MKQHTKLAVLAFFSGMTFLAPVTAEEAYSLEVSSNIGFCRIMCFVVCIKVMQAQTVALI